MTISKFKTAINLGLLNILSVIIYRVLLKFSLHPVCHINSKIPPGPFFIKSDLPPIQSPGTSSWMNSSKLFSFFEIPLKKEIPNWLVNPLKNNLPNFPLIDWWKIPDFDEDMGDIKLVWEQSRMDWVIAYAQRARNGDQTALENLNCWISDWLKHNPPYLGPNWKCGQESSIRVINLACASMILGNEIPESFVSLISLHLKRISPTMSYAISQNNNHGTSEAAALFIGGSLISSLGDQDGRKWEKQGRYWLENRVDKLVHSDGSFSQYSVNYHRMLLDTLSFSELWRKKMGLVSFSKYFYHKSSCATNWLYQMVSFETGEAPNIGSNDGSRLLQLTDIPFKDYRASIQLAMAVFQNKKAYPNHVLSNQHLEWLGIQQAEGEPPAYCNCEFLDGGYTIMRHGSVSVVFRFPQFHFRPCQADALHIDLWKNGINLLGDAGTYSYSDKKLFQYFSGTSAHNTIEFDERDQMPRISRFLFSNWLKSENYQLVSLDDNNYKIATGYSDSFGAKHHRSVSLSQEKLQIFDRVSGFKERAILRWRITNTKWKIDIEDKSLSITNGHHKLEVTSNVPIIRAAISNGFKSIHYLDKELTPILEVEINQPGKLISQYFFNVRN